MPTLEALVPEPMAVEARFRPRAATSGGRIVAEDSTPIFFTSQGWDVGALRAAPQPYVAPPGTTGGVWMHEDLGASDRVAHAGPRAKKGRYVRYARATPWPIAICPGFAFTKDWIVTASMGFGWSALLLLGPDGSPPASGDRKRNRKIPSRGLCDAAGVPDSDDPEVALGVMAKKIDRNFLTTSGGAYFVLDRSDQGDVLYVPTAQDGIRRLPISSKGFGALTVLRPTLRIGGDRLVGVMPGRAPGADGPTLWYVSERGQIGAFVDGVEQASFSLRTADNEGRELCGKGTDFAAKGESVLNSLSMIGEKLVVASSFALYAFTLEAGKVVRLGRAAYPRLGDTPDGLGFTRHPDNPCPGTSDGLARKRGQADFGTGTTPTRIGDDMIAICDGAKEMGLLVYKLEAGGLVLKSRVRPFPKAEVEACDNSVIYAPIASGSWIGQIIVGNTGGYRNPLVRDLELAGGLASYWVDANGTLSSTPAWELPDFVPWTATPKLAMGNELLYVYTRRKTPDGNDAWMVVGLRITPGLAPADRIAYEMPVSEAKPFALGNPRQLDQAENCWATFGIAPSGMLIGGVTSGYFTLADV